MFKILNGLQKEGFQINKKILGFIIKKNRATLEKVGFLMPEIIAHVNLKKAYDLMRNYDFNNKDIEKVFNLVVLFKGKGIRYQSSDSQVCRFNNQDSVRIREFFFYMSDFMVESTVLVSCIFMSVIQLEVSQSLPTTIIKMEATSRLLDIVASSAAFKYKKLDPYDDALQ